jgi:nucleotide-binding universal stress UspA family protein
MYSSIIVALDGSESAAAAIPHGLEMAIRFSVQLVLLSVIPGGAPGLGTSGVLPSASGGREHAALRSQAEGYLDSLKRSLRSSGVTIESLIREGDPASVILETARNLGDSPIVITPFGQRPSLPLGSLGSVADEVLRNAHGPVLLVRPERPAMVRSRR